MDDFLGLTYLDGEIVNTSDLKRAAVAFASAVFVLANNLANNPEEEDASSILRALAIKRHVQRERNRDVLTCIQLINPMKKAQNPIP